MIETKDCVCGNKDLSKLIANFKFVHCCHGNRRKTTKQLNGCFYNVLDHFFFKEKCSHQMYSVFW